MICLDSNCVIDYLNGRKEVVEAVSRYGDEVFTTEITLFEVFYGIYSKKNVDESELSVAKGFFDSITVFPFAEGCGDVAAMIMASLQKRGKSIEQNDCLIASVILVNGASRILTRNRKHFSRIKGLRVVGY